MTSWDEFDRRRKARAEPPPEQPDRLDADEICAAALTSPAGRRLLEWLDEAFTQAVLPADAPDSALRELNAKRHLVRELLRRRDAGLLARQKATKALG